MYNITIKTVKGIKTYTEVSKEQLEEILEQPGILEIRLEQIKERVLKK